MDQVWVKLWKHGRFEVAQAQLAMAPEPAAAVPPLSVAEALDASSPSLATIAKYRGEQVAVAYITSHLRHFSSLLHVVDGLSDSMLSAAARTIRRRYYHLKGADLLLCLDRALCGDYGKVFSRIDVASMLEFVGQYDEQRAAVAQTRKHQAKQDEADVSPNPELTARITAFREKLEAEAREAASAARIDQPSAGWNSLQQACEALDLDFRDAEANLQVCVDAEWRRHGGYDRFKASNILDEDGYPDFHIFWNMRRQQWLAALNAYYFSHPTTSNDRG